MGELMPTNVDIVRTSFLHVERIQHGFGSADLENILSRFISKTKHHWFSCPRVEPSPLRPSLLAVAQDRLHFPVGQVGSDISSKSF